MTKVIDICNKLFEALPNNGCIGCDNVGLLCGDANQIVTTVVTALDITDETIEYAKSVNSNLIISHHPVIFYPKMSFTTEDIAYKLVKENISAICMHTNLDFAKDGLNYFIAKMLNVDNIQTIGNITLGITKFKSISDLCNNIKQTLKRNTLEVYNSGFLPKNICIVTGSGGDYLLEAKQAGCDTIITGELKHHERMFASTLGMNVIIAGHYETEYPATKWFKLFVEKNFKDMKVFAEPFKNIFYSI